MAYRDEGSSSPKKKEMLTKLADHLSPIGEENPLTCPRLTYL